MSLSPSDEYIRLDLWFLDAFSRQSHALLLNETMRGLIDFK